MPAMNDTYDRLCTLLQRDFRLTREQLSPDAPLDTLGIDSLGLVELLWNIEDLFGVKLVAEPQGLVTVGDVVAFIDSLLAARSAVIAA
jgi:acyl carrier protein